jgi:glycosyltransferase involved in cell wall biosynthesis
MTRPAHVLHICDFAAPYGGSFIRQLELLDAELRGRGREPTAYGFPEDVRGADWCERLQAGGSSVHFLPRTSPRAPGRASWAVARAIHTTGCRIVHSHFGTYDVPVALAARRRPVVWHYRTELEQPVAERGSVRRLKDFMKFGVAGRGVDRFVAVTQALAREAAARGAGERACAVVAGCDTERFRPDAQARRRVREALGISDSSVVVLHLGWHWRRKGGDLLTAAARTLLERGVEDLVFLSLGAPPSEVVPPVTSLPFTERVEEVHQAADIFVSASRSEGFGNGLVEGLASGCVAVGTLVEGQREIFEGLPGCRSVPVEDPVAIADAVDSLLAQRERWPELGESNRAHIVRKYELRDWAHRMADVYDELQAPR